MLHWSTNIAALFALPSFASFLCLVTDRTSDRRTIFLDRSHCDSCQATLAVVDLIPVVSYLGLRRHCRHCGAQIPKRYFVTELVALLLGTLTLVVIGFEKFVFSLPLTCLLLALSYVDLKSRRLPNGLTFSLGALGLLIAPLVGGPLIGHILGAGLGLLVGLSIAGVYRGLRGQDGLGGGDVKFLAAAGAWVGLDHVFVVLLLSSVGALLFALATGRVSRNAALPFGPYIAAATWSVWCWKIALEGGA
jgi:leader peptidase (prepilin peptidase)/N-methyltransferase